MPARHTLQILPGRSGATILLSAALLLGAGCTGGTPGPAASGADPAAENQPGPAEDDAIAVLAGEATRDALTAVYATSATLRAERQAVVTARTRGVIRELLVEEGHTVAEGQPLVVLENDEQRIELDRALTARNTKQRELERVRSLHEQGLASDEEFETLRRETDETRQDAAMAELRLSRTLIRAPFAGRILTRHLDAGATVSDGSPVYDIADLDPLHADVNVPERHIARLRPGQSVRLLADASAETADARIQRIAPLVDPTSGTVKVTLAVDGTTRLRPGSFVRVEIVTDTRQDALVVPRAALVAEGRRWHVFRIVEEESGATVVERLEVTRGYEDRERVEILEVVGAAAPLEPGQQVVVTGASALSDGARVRLMPPSGDEPDAGDGPTASRSGAAGDSA